MDAKRCSKCGEAKTLDAFGKNGKRNGVQQYRSECMGCKNAYTRSWNAENVERKRVLGHAYYLTHTAETKARARQWQRNNPDNRATKRGRRRARERNAVHAPYSRSEIFAAYGGTCAYCDAPAEHIDHVRPISKGGADAAHNLLPACAPCNLGKGAKSLAEWALSWAR